MSTLFAELKRRNVLRIAAAYAVVAWLLLQMGEVTFEPMGFPDWAMPTLIVVVIIGFPISIILPWCYDSFGSYRPRCASTWARWRRWRSCFSCCGRRRLRTPGRPA